MENKFINTLYYGDNLAIMKEYMKDNSVDLIYLDPPFNSNRNYNIMYRAMTGQDVPEQVEAFCDTWELDAEKEQLASDMPIILRENGYDEVLAKFWEHLILALRNTQPKLLAYLVYMTIRLIEMSRVLKPTGSIYLHCDPTASHYIKIVMDGIFGYQNFRNEIVWYYYNKYSAGKKIFGRNYDQILFYSKTKNYSFTPQREKRKEPVKQLLRENVNGVLRNKKDDKGKIMYRFVDDKKIDSVWKIPCLQPASKERLGIQPKNQLHY